MELLNWMNKLQLESDMFTLVDKHYFKYLLFVKLTKGYDISSTDDMKECTYEIGENSLRIEMKFKKKIDIPELTSVMEENIHELNYEVEQKGHSIIITIQSDKEEVYTVANLLTANA